MSIVLLGSTSGSITLQEPAVAGSTVLNLPATSGTVMVNGPAFSVYLSSNQAISASTATKTQFDTKVFDTANCYDNTTNFRFTPTVAGYYQLSYGTATGVTGSLAAILYKNGSNYSLGNVVSSTAIGQQSGGSCLVYANGTTDYFEVYTVVTGSGQIQGNSSQVFFTGALVRGA